MTDRITPQRIRIEQERLAERFRDYAIARDNAAAIEAQILSMELRLEQLRALPEHEDRDLWCVDRTLDLSGDVGTAEVPGELTQHVWILPGHNAGAAYQQGRDGRLFSLAGQTPEQVFFNFAILPGWQKFRPTFRTGAILAIDSLANTVRVQLDEPTSSAQALPVNQATTLENVPVRYMTCNVGAFRVEDRVVVAFDDQDWDRPAVIGFQQNPVQCGASVSSAILRKPSSGGNAYDEHYWIARIVGETVVSHWMQCYASTAGGPWIDWAFVSQGTAYGLASYAGSYVIAFGQSPQPSRIYAVGDPEKGYSQLPINGCSPTTSGDNRLFLIELEFLPSNDGQMLVDRYTGKVACIDMTTNAVTLTFEAGIRTDTGLGTWVPQIAANSRHVVLVEGQEMRAYKLADGKRDAVSQIGERISRFPLVACNDRWIVTMGLTSDLLMGVQIRDAQTFLVTDAFLLNDYVPGGVVITPSVAYIRGSVFMICFPLRLYSSFSMLDAAYEFTIDEAGLHQFSRITRVSMPPPPPGVTYSDQRISSGRLSFG